MKLSLALFIATLFCVNVFAKKPVVIYMSGDYSSVEYHLGVLSEIERMQISIDTVVGSEWGNFVGALWSAGWSSKQIRELTKSFDSLPQAEQSQKSALLKKTWLVKHNKEGKLFFDEITENKPYFGQIFFDLIIQESLWRSDIGSKIPFIQTDSANNYPFPPNSPTTNSVRILSTSTALRDTNGTAEQRYQQKLWNTDSSLIILRPHSKPNSDSLFEAGVNATQSKRSVFSQINYSHLATQQQTSIALEFQPPPPRFLYHPVFDSVPAELQGHLKSFWNPKDTGILAVHNFLENLQNDGYYRDVKLTLDTGSFLQINSESNPQLSLSLMGFGGSLFGANIAANANFCFIDQFEYNFDLLAFYGQGTKGIEPSLRFERFFMDNGNFFAKLKIFEYEPIAYFQKNISNNARLINENGRIVALGIEKPLGTKTKFNEPVLQISVEIDRKEITSGASAIPIYEENNINRDNEETENHEEPTPSYYIYEAVSVNSLFPYAKWSWQSDGYNRWFASDGFMAELLGGFKAISVQSIGQNLPLYVSSQGKIGISHLMANYISVSGMAEFGVNFRRTDKGKIVLPDKLNGYHHEYDQALDNRYKFAMGMGVYQEYWQTPNNSSHLYGILSAGLSLQWKGSGIFLHGGFAKNGQQDRWSELEAERLFAEPKIRIKTDVFDFVLGRNIIYYPNIKHSDKKSENRLFLRVQSD